ncbi:MAG: protein translocase subunit SecF [Deltaproteobacteria bacterium]|uniref:Protein-export membrane protein SecF n=1 Tax=Candidatus Zymogenus saltonus TaxID=2844893 RepID=A0A9D8KDM7_9DELT|nr:protein translocase subunit SecF [Candidatus Zymogenus saltonus]
MELIKPGTKIDFIGKRRYAYLFSLILIAVSVGSLILHGGPNYGIDFAGGSLIQVKFNKAVGIKDVKNVLLKMGLKEAIVQNFKEGEENEYIIRVVRTEMDITTLSEKVKENMDKKFGFGSVDLRRVEMVGPKVGEDLKKKGLYAVLLAVVGILIYVSVRFEFRYALGAVIALVHDATITLGAFSILNLEVSLPIVAAILTVIGYSINDTIVVFDRVRENMRKARKTPEDEVMNESINETLSRTIMTSGMTLLAVLALYFFGGGVIHDFAFALIVGIVIGTYSTIYIASPVVLIWNKLFPQKSPLQKGRRKRR